QQREEIETAGPGPVQIFEHEEERVFLSELAERIDELERHALDRAGAGAGVVADAEVAIDDVREPRGRAPRENGPHESRVARDESIEHLDHRGEHVQARAMPAPAGTAQ